jgi:hypothetical protein
MVQIIVNVELGDSFPHPDGLIDEPGHHHAWTSPSVFLVVTPGRIPPSTTPLVVCADVLDRRFPLSKPVRHLRRREGPGLPTLVNHPDTPQMLAPALAHELREA